MCIVQVCNIHAVLVHRGRDMVDNCIWGVGSGGGCLVRRDVMYVGELAPLHRFLLCVCLLLPGCFVFVHVMFLLCSKSLSIKRKFPMVSSVFSIYDHW